MPCNINAITTGNHTYVVSYAPGAETSAEQTAVSVNALAAGPLDYTDMWWAGSQEDGWGMNIAQQGRVLFPVWYTYDASGKAVFFAVPGGIWSGSTFTGDIYSTVASPWLGASYDPSLFRANLVGSMTLSFVDLSNAVMRYTVNGVTQTKNIVRQPY